MENVVRVEDPREQAVYEAGQNEKVKRANEAFHLPPPIPPYQGEGDESGIS
jgi:hypothetical protein